jgi:hypothetical protein
VACDSLGDFVVRLQRRFAAGNPYRGSGADDRFNGAAQQGFAAGRAARCNGSPNGGGLNVARFKLISTMIKTYPIARVN